MGYAGAQYNLGMMYYLGCHDPFDGNGVTQDYKQAHLWFKKAAKLKHAGAHNNLGVMYYNGHGVEQNFKASYLWNKKAIALGNQNAKRFRKKILKKLTSEQIAKIEEKAEKQKEKLAKSEE